MVDQTPKLQNVRKDTAMPRGWRRARSTTMRLLTLPNSVRLPARVSPSPAARCRTTNGGGPGRQQRRIEHVGRKLGQLIGHQHNERHVADNLGADDHEQRQQQDSRRRGGTERRLQRAPNAGGHLCCGQALQRRDEAAAAHQHACSQTNRPMNMSRMDQSRWLNTMLESLWKTSLSTATSTRPAAKGVSPRSK